MKLTEIRPSTILLVILLLCAIAYGSTMLVLDSLADKRAQNETIARTMLSTIHKAEIKYRTDWPDGCFTDLDVLHYHKLIDSDFGRTGSRGYFYIYAQKDCGRFYLFAIPDKTDGLLRTGDHWFAMSEDGRISESGVDGLIRRDGQVIGGSR